MNSFICSQCHILLISQLKMIHGTYRILVYEFIIYWNIAYHIKHGSNSKKNNTISSRKNLPKVDISSEKHSNDDKLHLVLQLHRACCLHRTLFPLNKYKWIAFFISLFFNVFSCCFFFSSLMYFSIFNSQNKSARFCW